MPRVKRLTTVVVSSGEGTVTMRTSGFVGAHLARHELDAPCVYAPLGRDGPPLARLVAGSAAASVGAEALKESIVGGDSGAGPG